VAVGVVATVPPEVRVSILLCVSAVTIVHALRWRASRAPYLGWWTFAWLLLGVRYALVVTQQTFDVFDPTVIVAVARDICFIGGAGAYAGRRWLRWWLPLAALDAIAVLAHLMSHPRWGIAFTLFHLSLAAIAGGTVAVVLARSTRPAPRARWLGAAAFVLYVILTGTLAVPNLGGVDPVVSALCMEAWMLAAGFGIAIADLEATGEMRTLAARTLGDTMAHVIAGHTAVCSNCHRVQGADRAWRRPEEFVRERSRADVTHGICPACIVRVFGFSSDLGSATD